VRNNCKQDIIYILYFATVTRHQLYQHYDYLLSIGVSVVCSPCYDWKKFYSAFCLLSKRKSIERSFDLLWEELIKCGVFVYILLYGNWRSRPHASNQCLCHRTNNTCLFLYYVIQRDPYTFIVKLRRRANIYALGSIVYNNKCVDILLHISSSQLHINWGIVEI